MVARSRWLMLSAGSVVLLGLGSLASGCGGSDTKADPYRMKIVHPRIDESLLADRGLETVVSVPPDPVDTSVQQVTLVPGGLVIATQPTPEKKGRLKFLNRKGLEAKWHFALDYPLEDPPTIYRYPRGGASKTDEIYFAQLDKVYCLDLEYGSELWSADVPYPISTSVVADELNYFLGSDNARAYGFRKRSGVEEWTYRTGGNLVASPVVLGSSVFFASTDGALCRLFSVQPGWIVGSSWELRTGGRIVGDPTIYSRWVLVGSADYKLYCVDVQDGSVFWSFPAEAPIEEAPVVYSHQTNQEFAYCVTVQRSAGAETRTLFALRLRDGQEVWRRTGLRKVVALGRNTLYALNDPKRGEGRALVALDILDGKERFRLPLENFDFIPHNSADFGRNAEERGRIYLVAQDGTIQVIRERM